METFIAMPWRVRLRRQFEHKRRRAMAKADRTGEVQYVVCVDGVWKIVSTMPSVSGSYAYPPRNTKE